jgi:hypothetical protein
MFTKQDFSQIGNKGMELHVIEKQIDHFVTGFPFIRLVRPATADDGILRFNDEQQTFFLNYFETNLPALKVIKFVPASGAASRMFKHLFEFMEKYTNDENGLQLFLNDQHFNSVYYFINHLNEIAFYDDLSAVVAKSGKSLNHLIESRDYSSIIDYILSVKGLNPKRCLNFINTQTLRALLQRSIWLKRRPIPKIMTILPASILPSPRSTRRNFWNFLQTLKAFMRQSSM